MLMATHRPGHKSPIFPQVMRLLAEKGAQVEILCPEERVADLARVRVEHDLYVLKSSTPAAYSLAGALHFLGAAILNPFPVSLAMRDKVIATRLLQGAGVLVPQTFVAGRPEQLAPLLAEGPLIIKPHTGSKGQGVRIVRDRAELATPGTETGLVFAQRYHKPEGEDYKIYSINNRLFGVRRIWPPRNFEDKLGKPFVLSSELRQIVARSGRAFAAELFGLDVIRSDGKYYVVDMSSFPGFKGVPDAALHLADYIHTVCQRVMAGEPVLQKQMEGGA
jgi:ribosomal protein S6--L-glutamate ligase